MNWSCISTLVSMVTRRFSAGLRLSAMASLILRTVFTQNRSAPVKEDSLVTMSIFAAEIVTRAQR